MKNIFEEPTNSHAVASPNREFDNMMSRENLPDYLSKLEQKVGPIGSLIMGARNSKRIRGQVEELLSTQLRYQQEQMTYKVTLSFDQDKKRLFAEYMLRVDALHGSIVDKSDTMVRNLVNTMQRSIIAAYEQAFEHKNQLNQMNVSGVLTEDQLQREHQRVETWCNLLKDDIEAKVRIICENHAKAVERTVELFESEYAAA